MFGYKNPVKLDNSKVYCYREDLNGMYLYWKGDENALTASTTASAFNAGYLALAGIGGLAIGILGTVLVMTKGRKKKEEAAEKTADIQKSCACPADAWNNDEVQEEDAMGLFGKKDKKPAANLSSKSQLKIDVNKDGA